ncbi:hypothetical protein N9Y67_04705, partial [Pseudomonadota bacterium]|nr:hypothetical protein [Pseudomonadota bacterium]
MDMTDPILQMLAYELAAVLAVICIWLIMRANKKAKAVNISVTKAVKKFKRIKDARITTISGLLSGKYDLSDDAVNQTANEI